MTLAVGLVGAGPWAGMVHAPMLAAGPETRLAAVWARRPEAAEGLAREHGTVAARSVEELLDSCEAVAFAVPPDVQAALAVRAAAAGKHLLLEKPLALDVDGARQVVAAVDAAGVVSQLVLSQRYRRSTREFLQRVALAEPVAAQLAFLSGAVLPGAPFATPWRLEHGALLDVGPHAIDLLQAALGPIESISGAGDPRRVIAVTCTHRGGVVSEALLSIATPLATSVSDVAVYTTAEALRLERPAEADDPPWPTVRAEFAAAVRDGRPHPLDAHHGLRLQELLAAAEPAAVAG